MTLLEDDVTAIEHLDVPTAVEMPPGLVLPTPLSERPKGGAGSPELARMTEDGRKYFDPLPWCPLLGTLGVPESGFELNAEFGSVTTLLGNLPKDRLIKWTAKMVAECAAEYAWVRDAFGDAIAIDYWSRAGERFRDMAGERGTLVHDVAEDGASIIHAAADELLAGHGVPARFVEQANVAPYVRALQKFFADWPGIEPIWTEVTVFSRRFGYAGTLDFIAYVPGLGLILGDWKSSRLTHASMSMQLAAYRWADYGIVDGRRIPLPQVQAAYIVHLMPGEEGDGAYELVPADSSFDIVEDIFPAMHSVRRHDRPSKIGKPVTPAALGQAVPQRPPLQIITPEQASALVLVSGPGALHEACVDPYVRLQHEKAVVRQWAIDYCREVSAALAKAAQAGNAEADRCGSLLFEWWQQNQVPPFSDPRMTDPDQFEDVFAVLLEGLEMAERVAELPFGYSKPPQEFDWDALLARYIDEQRTAVEAGLIELVDGEYRPVPQAPQLGEHTVTLARRGRSVSASSWQTDRDPELRAVEDALIERARRLPADLFDGLVAWARQVGVPNLEMRVCSRQQLDAVAAQIATLETRRQGRADAWREAVAPTFRGDFTAAEQAFRALFHERLGAPLRAMHDLTRDQIRIVQLMCDAAAAGVVGMAVDTWYVEDATEAALLAWFGSKREILKCGREVAARLGMPAPKSSGDVVACPVLVALLHGVANEIEASGAGAETLSDEVETEPAA